MEAQGVVEGDIENISLDNTTDRSSVLDGLPDPGTHTIEDSLIQPSRNSTLSQDETLSLEEENSLLRERLDKVDEANANYRKLFQATLTKFDLIENLYIEQKKENLRLELSHGKLRNHFQDECATSQHFEWIIKNQHEEMSSIRKSLETDTARLETEQAAMELELRDAQVAALGREELQKSHDEQARKIEKLIAERQTIIRAHEVQTKTILEMQARLDDFKLKQPEPKFVEDPSKEALERTYKVQLRQIEEYQSLLEDAKYNEEEALKEADFKYKGEISRLEERNELLQHEVNRLSNALDDFEHNDKLLDIGISKPVSSGTLVQRLEGNIASSTLKRRKGTLHRKPKLDPGIPGGVPEDCRGLFITERVQDHVLEMRIKAYLLRCEMAIARKSYTIAEQAAFDASQLAELLENIPIMARCAYWRGRAELASGQFLAAVHSFELAEPCVGRYLEGEDLQRLIAEAIKSVPQDYRATDTKTLSEELNSSCWRSPLRTTATGKDTGINVSESNSPFGTQAETMSTLLERKEHDSDRDAQGPQSLLASATTGWSRSTSGTPRTLSSLSESGMKSAQLHHLERESYLSRTRPKPSRARRTLDFEDPGMIVPSTPDQPQKRPSYHIALKKPRLSAADTHETVNDNASSEAAPSPRLLELRNDSMVFHAVPIQQRAGRKGHRRASQQLSVDLRVQTAEKFIQDQSPEAEKCSRSLNTSNRWSSTSCSATDARAAWDGTPAWHRVHELLPDIVSRTIRDGRRDFNKGLKSCYSIGSRNMPMFGLPRLSRAMSAPLRKAVPATLLQASSQRPSSSHSALDGRSKSGRITLAGIQEDNWQETQREDLSYDNNALGETF